jgi:hypothetical protein
MGYSAEYISKLCKTSGLQDRLRGMGKYADDAYRSVKKSIKEYKPRPPKHLSVPKDCPNCENGYYWFNGYKYECGHCKGKGTIFERVY